MNYPRRLKHYGVTGSTPVGYPTSGSRQAVIGLKVASDKLSLDWNAPENVLNIRKCVDLLRGCSCKKGNKTKRSFCREAGGPGCSSCNCATSPVCSSSEEVDTTVENEEIAEDSYSQRRGGCCRN